MASKLPLVYLARHGETPWTLSGQHTGRTDLEMTERGERNAIRLGDRLSGLEFAAVFTSPLTRAKRTCDLAGFAHVAVVDPDLMEWDYGQMEGRKTAEIRKDNPGWGVFRDGCPGGESVADITARADRMVQKIRAVDGGDVLVFSSGHFLRVLTARWCGQPITMGEYLLLGTASLSILGYDHGVDEPAIKLWNATRHVVN